MEITLRIPEYTQEKGLLHTWEDGFEIENKIIGNEIIISANCAGLTSLAKQLLTLAQGNVPVGSHFHLDQFSGLEEGSIDLVIQKI
ncbi:hypothetical protein [Pedobacter sp. Hv1]|uniref:Imm32 family immunity protein n=1 Tax=Pedobacter sp. Hv1 TaxID=1740090 RepID=UPI0006D8B48D|nr:hypothetical protein [Pedobacter sp. Hv1]KQB98928.1 hypothetical protein AQF98_19555 [Pedobacter sp. Hv1]